MSDAGIERTGSFESEAEADLAIFQQLQELGADLRLPREVNHYVFFPDEDVARKVASEYAKDLRTEVGKEPDGRWSVRMTHVAVVTSDDFAKVRASLTRMASALGGLYDGWEASAKP
jgi:hypothetical protein